MIKKISMFFLCLLLLASPLWAVESVTQTFYRIPNMNLATLTFAVVAAADGSVTATATDTANTAAIEGWFVYMVVTDPGATQPQALWDATITDANGVDIMGGVLADRSATATQQVVPLIGGSYGPRPVSGALTLNISGNNVNSATLSVIIYLTR